MKRFLMLLLCAVPLFCHAAGSDVVIDKENCTITKDGETFPLYGRVKIVDDFADVRVKIVDDFADVRVKIVDDFADSCGRITIVDDFADIRVEIVEDFADIRVKLVDSFVGF